MRQKEETQWTGEVPVPTAEEGLSDAQAADLAAYLSHTEPLTEQAAQNAGADLQQRQGIWQGVTPPQTPAPRH